MGFIRQPDTRFRSGSYGVEVFEVTEEWVKAFQSGNRGWNRAQLECIGVEWPPQKGWIQRIEGTSISEVAKARFEQLKGKTLVVLKQEQQR